MNLDKAEHEIDEVLDVARRGCRGLYISPCLLLDESVLEVRIKFSAVVPPGDDPVAVVKAALKEQMTKFATALPGGESRIEWVEGYINPFGGVGGVEPGCRLAPNPIEDTAPELNGGPLPVVLGVFVVLVLLWLAASAFGADVKKFGAVGDGVTDDTFAIAAAAADCRARLQVIQPAGGSYMGSCPDLCFPAGKYLISAAIALNPYQTVRGEGAILVQADPKASIFVCDGGYQNRFVGMQFVGGSRQVVFQNANVDSSFLTFRDCAFQGWGSYAIWAEGTVDDLHLSTTLSVDRCRFDGGCAIYTHCDTTQISNGEAHFRGPAIPNGGGWLVNKGFRRPGGVFSYGGSVGISNMTLVPAAPVVPAEDGSKPKAVNAYWIVNEGSVVCDRVRFSGEGAGVPILLHKAPVNLRNPWRGSKVVFDSCQVSCGQDSDQTAAVVTVLGGFPQAMRFVGNDGLVSNKISWVRVGQGYDVAADIAAIKAAAPASLPMYSIVLQGNQSLSAAFPVPLQQFVK